MKTTPCTPLYLLMVTTRISLYSVTVDLPNVQRLVLKKIISPKKPEPHITQS